MQQYIDISPYRDILGMILYQYTIDTHFSCINTSNIMIYQYIDIKIVYICIQYFMTDAVVVAIFTALQLRMYMYLILIILEKVLPI